MEANATTAKVNNKSRLFGLRSRKQDGFTLLEYCAGAAVLLVVIWGALNLLGKNMETLLGSIGNWATSRASEIDSAKATGQ